MKRDGAENENSVRVTLGSTPEQLVFFLLLKSNPLKARIKGEMHISVEKLSCLYHKVTITLIHVRCFSGLAPNAETFILQNYSSHFKVMCKKKWAENIYQEFHSV